MACIPLSSLPRQAAGPAPSLPRHQPIHSAPLPLGNGCENRGPQERGKKKTIIPTLFNQACPWGCSSQRRLAAVCFLILTICVKVKSLESIKTKGSWCFRRRAAIVAMTTGQTKAPQTKSESSECDIRRVVSGRRSAICVCVSL